MTAAEWLARARAVTDGATPGPWETVPGAANVWRFPEDGSARLVVAGNGSQGHRTRLPDAAFIAASRTLLPAAVAAIEAVLAREDVLIAEVGHQVYEATDLEPEECTDDCPACAIEEMFAAITAALDGLS